MKSKPCFLYVIYDEGVIYGDGGFHKIGISSDPDARLASIQTGNPRKLYLSATWRLRSDSEARRIERLLHRGARRHRVSGEWFASNNHEAVLHYVCKLIGRNPGVNRAPARLCWLYDHRSPNAAELAPF